MNLNLELPINNLSFGNVSFCILKELYKRGISPNIFLTGQVNLSAFDVAPDFKTWLECSINKAQKHWNRSYPTFKLWHINGSHSSVGRDQVLFTFHECSELTDDEVNILKNQKKVLTCSEWSVEVFKSHGIENVEYCPLGFDSDSFKIKNRNYYGDRDLTVWAIYGKMEKRKATLEATRAWIKKYGKDPKHMLHLAVYNTFFEPQHNEQFYNQIFDGNKPFNVNVIPFMEKNSQYNEALNSAHIVIAPSRSEAWGLPEFQSVCLGKHAVVHNAAGYKGWANSNNSVFVEPSSMMEVYDGIFFHKGQPFNQGSYHNWNEDDFIKGFDTVLSRFKLNKINEEGKKLATEFTYSKMVDKILENLK